MVKDFVEGNFKVGVVNYGLKEDGVGLIFVICDSEFVFSDFVGQEVIDKVKVINEDIIFGKIVVKDLLQ